MQPGQFKAETTRDAHGTTIAVSGELDIATVSEFNEAVEAALADSEHVDIDLRRLDFVDSSGLRAMVDVHSASKKGGFTYRIIPAPPQVHRTFVLTGLDKVLTFA